MLLTQQSPGDAYGKLHRSSLLDPLDNIVFLTTGFNISAHISRYTSTGAVDNTFNDTGTFMYTDPNPDNELDVTSLGQTPTNQLIMGGKLTTSTDAFIWLMRLNQNGTADSTFGTNGIVTLP